MLLKGWNPAHCVGSSFQLISWVINGYVFQSSSEMNSKWMWLFSHISVCCLGRLSSGPTHCCWVTSVISDSVRPHRRQPTRLPHPWDSSGKNTGVGCHFLLQCMKVDSEIEVTQSCLTPSDPVDCSLPGSSVHGIFQARVLEWGAIAFSAVPATHIQPTPMTSHPGILRRTWSKVPLHGSPICLRPYQHVRGPPLTVLSRGGKGQG